LQLAENDSRSDRLCQRPSRHRRPGHRRSCRDHILYRSRQPGGNIGAWQSFTRRGIQSSRGFTGHVAHPFAPFLFFSSYFLRARGETAL